MIFGSPSAKGEPRLRMDVVLRLKPEVLERLAKFGNDELLEIGARLERAVTFNLEEVEVLSTSSVAFRENTAADPTAMFQEMMNRLPLPKREPWEGGEPPA